MSASQKLTNAYKCVDDYKLFNPQLFMHWEYGFMNSRPLYSMEIGLGQIMRLYYGQYQGEKMRQCLSIDAFF